MATASMTAFSRQQKDGEWGSLTWEIRSVNHRYLETSIRLPDTLRSLETGVRETLRKRLNRGKVECQLRLQPAAAGAAELHIDRDLVVRLGNASREIQELTGSAQQPGSIDYLRWPGVIVEQSMDDAALQQQALTLFEDALDELIANRQREGEALEGFLLQRLEAVSEIVASVRARMPQILTSQRENLLARLQDLRAELDATRLEQEVAILAQKADVDEELDRLDSHVEEVKRVVNANGPKGRRLDFLMQELNREANTLSSKAVVVDTTMGAVELKVLIEQLREQIQNIE